MKDPSIQASRTKRNPHLRLTPQRILTSSPRLELALSADAAHHVHVHPNPDTVVAPDRGKHVGVVYLVARIAELAQLQQLNRSPQISEVQLTIVHTPGSVAAGVAPGFRQSEAALPAQSASE